MCFFVIVCLFCDCLFLVLFFLLERSTGSVEGVPVYRLGRSERKGNELT